MKTLLRGEGCVELLGGGCSLPWMHQGAKRTEGRGARDPREVGGLQGRGAGEREEGLPRTLREETCPVGAF